MSETAPDWLEQLPPLLAGAMTAIRLDDVDRAAQIIANGIGDSPLKQYASACLLARVIASKAPCPGDHDGPCNYQVYVHDSNTGARKQWDDVSKAQLFTIQFIMAMVHLDAKQAKALYFQALKDGCFADGFMNLLLRAAETTQSTGKQSITWH